MKRKGSQEEPKTKSRYQMIIDGDVEPRGAEKGYINLEAGRQSFNTLAPERLKEISRKGAAAVNKLHGEKKTAREALEKILTLKINDEIIAGADLPPEIAERLKRDNPNATLYDLIQIVAVGRAVGGNIKAAEYIRDTFGDKPKDQIEVSGVMTDQDREMLQQINARLSAAEIVQVIDAEPEPGKREKEPKRE